jgi:hypothetical protein
MHAPPRERAERLPPRPEAAAPAAEPVAWAQGQAERKGRLAGRLVPEMTPEMAPEEVPAVTPGEGTDLAWEEVSVASPGAALAGMAGMALAAASDEQSPSPSVLSAHCGTVAASYCQVERLQDVLHLV